MPNDVEERLTDRKCSTCGQRIRAKRIVARSLSGPGYTEWTDICGCETGPTE